MQTLNLENSEANKIGESIEDAFNKMSLENEMDYRLI